MSWLISLFQDYSVEYRGVPLDLRKVRYSLQLDPEKHDRPWKQSIVSVSDNMFWGLEGPRKVFQAAKRTSTLATCYDWSVM